MFCSTTDVLNKCDPQEQLCVEYWFIDHMKTNGEQLVSSTAVPPLGKKKPGFLSSSLNESLDKVMLLIREASVGFCSTYTDNNVDIKITITLTYTSHTVMYYKYIMGNRRVIFYFCCFMNFLIFFLLFAFLKSH